MSYSGFWLALARWVLFCRQNLVSLFSRTFLFTPCCWGCWDLFLALSGDVFRDSLFSLLIFSNIGAG